MVTKQAIISSAGTVDFDGSAYAVSIQATPGTQFRFLSENSVEQEDYITMGPSGIYELHFSSPMINGVYFNYIVGSLPIIIDYILENQQEGR